MDLLLLGNIYFCSVSVTWETTVACGFMCTAVASASLRPCSFLLEISPVLKLLRSPDTSHPTAEQTW